MQRDLPYAIRTPRRAAARRRGALALVLAAGLAVAGGCRGDEGGGRETGFIAVHEEARAALAAFKAKDDQALRRALERLGQVGQQPELLATPELVRRVSLSRGGNYLVVGFGRSLGGSKLIVLDATSARPILGLRGYGESFSRDDRWLACLQHRYSTPEPGADVGSYEVLLLVDLGRVRGAASDDPSVFRSIVQDTEGLLRGGETEFIGEERIRVTRDEPPLSVVYDFEGNRISEGGRRWRYLKLF